MTNIDPGGFLILLTVIPAVVAGVVSVALAHILARFGYGGYERNVVAVLGVMVAAWIGAALTVSSGMLNILAVALAMLGAYAATRSIRASSYGWVLGVLLLLFAFWVLAAAGVYQGVDPTGVPKGIISQHLMLFYTAGLFVCGAVAGMAVRFIQRHRNQ